MLDPISLFFGILIAGLIIGFGALAIGLYLELNFEQKLTQMLSTM